MVHYVYLSFKKTINRCFLKNVPRKCVNKNIMFQDKSGMRRETPPKSDEKRRKELLTVCALFNQMTLYGNRVNITPRIPNTDSGG